MADETLNQLLAGAIILSKLFVGRAYMHKPVGEKHFGRPMSPEFYGIIHAVENVDELSHCKDVRVFLADHAVDLDPDELTSRRLLLGAVELTRLITDDPESLPAELYESLRAHFNSTDGTCSHSPER